MFKNRRKPLLYKGYSRGLRKSLSFAMLEIYITSSTLKNEYIHWCHIMDILLLIFLWVWIWLLRSEVRLLFNSQWSSFMDRSYNSYYRCNYNEHKYVGDVHVLYCISVYPRRATPHPWLSFRFLEGLRTEGVTSMQNVELFKENNTWCDMWFWVINKCHGLILICRR